MLKEVKDRVARFLKDQRTKSIMDYRRKKSMRFLNRYPTPKALTASQEKEIRDFWYQVSGTHKLYFNIKFYEMFNDFGEDPSLLKYYIPNDFYYPYVDLFFADEHYARVFDDKTLYELYFPDVKHPETLVRRSGHCILDKHYDIISEEKAVQLCHDAGKVIFKPSIIDSGGNGIVFWSEADGEDRLRKMISSKHHYVIQRIVEQHESLRRVHSSSVNTVRVLTLLFNGSAHVMSAILRMGVDGNQVDNGSAGGICCGILPDGHLRPYARKLNGEKFDKHPQGMSFSEVFIPHFDTICQMACKMAPRVEKISRLISWDFSVTPDGEPLLIESNFYYGGCDVHQFCNGPIFGDMTEEVLRYVFQHHPMLRMGKK